MSDHPASRTPVHPVGRVWASVVRATSEGVDHKDVLRRVGESGRLGGGYVMMTAISAAIAILGLLLSSPAVVIGAMLLSPLMGPILLLGISFWMVDWASMRRALLSLAVGFGIALAVSIVLTALSPLKEPTAEILARSRPTLFDLLVAIFSGIAGGYAIVRHRGETVIGVAIATALMPPLAVVGFALGTQAWSIAGGALLLFFTNLIAIALAAAAIAAVSGFRSRVLFAQRGWLHHAAVIAILAALCVPLTLSLRTIALESRATAQARSDVAAMFGPKSRIASLSVRSGKTEIEVDGLVATQHYVENASDQLAQKLRAGLHTPVAVSLDEVVLADPSKLKAAPATGAPPSQDPTAAASAALRAAVPFPDDTIGIDRRTGAGFVLLAQTSGLDILGAHALETALRAHPKWSNVIVVPPVQPLAPVSLTRNDQGRAVLSDASLQVWALSRWRVGGVAAELCQPRRRLPLSQVAPLVAGAFAPLGVHLDTQARCSVKGAAPPYIRVEPAAAPPAPVLAAPPTPPGPQPPPP